MRLKQFWVVFLFVGVSPALHGQGTATNLSGRWQLNVEKSALVKKPSNPPLLTITCVGNKVQMVYTSKGIERKEQYTADGKERTASIEHETEIVEKAYWRDGVLVIETYVRERTSNGVWGGLWPYGPTESWSLLPDGLTLKHETYKSKRVAVYDKVQ